MTRARTPLPRLTTFAAALFSFALFTLAPAAHAQTGCTVTVTDLNPSGGTSSQANGVSGGKAVGDGARNGSLHALLWSGTAASAVDLHPSGYSGSFATGVSGDAQVGYAKTLNGSVSHAVLWHSTPGSVVDLQPDGFTQSQATGTDGPVQVGCGAPIGSFYYHALLWLGTAESAVDLTPPDDFASLAYAVSGDTQVGEAQGTATGNLPHATLWHGTAASAVDLNPEFFTETFAYGTSGAAQVGTGFGDATGYHDHALLWHGTAGSVVDLGTAGFSGAEAQAASVSAQVGDGFHSGAGGQNVGHHAILWRGTADSALDLNVFLPKGYNDTSQAFGVDESEGTIRVVGYGSGSKGQHAFLWHVVSGAFGKPVLLHLYPASRTEGEAGFTLTVAGMGYTSQSVVQWNGRAQTTAFVSGSTLTAPISAALLAHAGTAQVTVFTPGGSTSNARPETIMARPAVNTLSPATKTAGSGAFTLIVTGTGFRAQSFYAPSVVKWNGTELATTYVSDTKLTAQVPASLLTHAGTASVTVTTPQVATSGAKTFALTP